ncbi:DNA cytosine methyltransferase [Ottowia sp.]|uniref:DNA cytosine methyltransferase n=1 Tax=Ottowia sp. TaxID=1898956 RepID=UPI0025F4EC81|nr:DNA cytosine methyltransferase [Ottowia sp.]MBK6614172.1 DNA cytosine methyltransferase [Ottowia sp.]
MATDQRLARFKLDRLASGAVPKVLELCSGCGGLSLGLQTAGLELAAHVESNGEANATYALNFAPDDAAQAKQWARSRDMVTQPMDELIADFGLSGKPHEVFDVLAAGLPCQAFARIGRSKLRSVTGDDDAFKNDPRASLYRRFLEIVDETRPLAIIVENVPDIMNFGGHNVPEEIADGLKARGYVTRYTLLNAAFYGVPQLRERLFLIAVDTSLNVTPLFPSPSHFMELPRGYESSRAVALKHVKKADSHFSPIPVPSADLPRSVSVESALADLPFISDHLRDTEVIRKRKVADRLTYREIDLQSTYAGLMRDWKGFSTGPDVSGNVVRLTTRDFPIFGRMPRGGDYPVALEIAAQLLAEKLQAEGTPPRPGTIRYEALKKATIPPYDGSKFPNKWWKLDPNAPSRTLTAHLGKDTYSHIHFDGRQKRMISVREAARLQSFPDGFEFAGAMSASFRQIGNAVPPLLGLAVGRALMKILEQAVADMLAGEQRVA